MRKILRSWISVLWICFFTNGANSDISFKDTDFDGFIEELFKSNKFKQLVETIAEITAEKIHNLDIKFADNKESKDKSHRPTSQINELKTATELKTTGNTSNKLMLKYKLFTQNLESPINRRRSKGKITHAVNI